ncbi:MAG: four helix bundle protein [Bacteroidota bacterium]
MKTFEELEVYQKALNFTVKIFKLTENSSINYNIRNQLERAALSISNNIAEGFELQSNKQFVKFLYISKGSSGECRNILKVAKKMQQVEDIKYDELNENIVEISKQLSNFIKYLENSEIR